MKKILFVIAAALLLFGCTGIPGGLQNATKNMSVPALPNASNVAGAVANVTQQPSCSPSYSFSAPAPAVLSGTSVLSGTATCAADKELTVYVGNAQVAQATVSGDPGQVSFNLPATTDGMVRVSVQSDGAIVYSADWTVSPIGYATTAGTDNDQISVKNWKAVAFDVDNPITVTSVSAFLRTLQTSTLANTVVIADIRADSGGSPGGIVATASLPITKVTMTPNWISFPVEAQLQKGRYWVVFRVDQPSSQLVSDSVNILYVAVDKNQPGDADHKKMDLVRNDQAQTWDQTTWQPLAYARNYAFKVSASG
jgi:hypothetical protein